MIFSFIATPSAQPKLVLNSKEPKRPLGFENKLQRVLTVSIRTLNEWEVYGLEKLTVIFEVFGEFL